VPRRFAPPLPLRALIVSLIHKSLQRCDRTSRRTSAAHGRMWAIRTSFMHVAAPWLFAPPF
jgi:hypothetical protein